MAEWWEGVLMIALGVGATLVGQRLRYRYVREFDAARAEHDPVYEMNASLMRRFVAVFLTAGAMLGIFGVYFAASTLWSAMR